MTYMLLLNCALKLVEEIILRRHLGGGSGGRSPAFVDLCTEGRALQIWRMRRELYLVSEELL